MEKHILFIVENTPATMDQRVWNEALSMKEKGYDVTVISPKYNNTEKNYESIEGINVYRHFTPPDVGRKYAFILEYCNAFIFEFVLSLKIFLSKPFQYIHAANPPDHIFFIAIFFKLLDVKFIFDQHDLCPENYLAKFGKKDLFYRSLQIMEKLTFKTADIVITTNESYKKIAMERGKVSNSQIFVVRNGPNLSRVLYMEPNEKLKQGFDYLVTYVGKMGNQEGIDNLLRTIKYIVHERKVKSIKFILIGPGPDRENMMRYSEKLKLNRFVQFTGYIPYREFCEILATSDICVNPEFRNSFTDKSTMVKIMDYMTFGKPIIQYETTEGKVTAGDSAVYIKENNEIEFAEAIINLLENESRRKIMGNIGKKRIEEMLNWDKQKDNLIKAYNFFL